MSVIATISNKCRRCYSCVRNCPVKAVRMVSGQASVIESSCICCGLCIRVCSQQAKQVRDDTGAVMQLLAQNNSVIALLAPSFVAAFDVSPEQIIGALKIAGFARVCDVAYGAELVAGEYAKLLAGPLQHPVLTSPCPAIVGLVEKHFPAQAGKLAPLVSPMIAMAKLVRELYGKKCGVVFIGPCIAKKMEIEHPAVHGDVDVVLTFTELKVFLSARGVSLAKAKPMNFDGPVGGLANAFPLAGGLLKALQIDRNILDEQFLVVEGNRRTVEALQAMELGRLPPALVDVLFCRGCVDGPEFTGVQEYFQRCAKVTNYTAQRQSLAREVPQVVRLRLSRKFMVLPDKKKEMPQDGQIKKVLEATGKLNPEDELNCGACGYDTCREKALAVCMESAEVDMCLPFLLQKKEQEVDQCKREIERLELSRGLAKVFIGSSPKIEEVRKFILKAAQGTSTILLMGESGTGKGLAARAIHNNSRCREGSFVHVNCSAIPESLLESELFGYEGGAFTGAQKGGKPGKFELAHNGTIFLDEIGDMPLVMQAKLLRALQEKVIERVGGTRSIFVNVRIIVATNKDLPEEIKKGKFREDLYYRVNVLTAYLPPLRDMADDIPLMLEETIAKVSERCGLLPRKISMEAVQAFCRYSWPGNVRELEHMLERLLNLVDDGEIRLEHLPASVLNCKEQNAEVHGLERLMAEVEKDAIVKALQSTGNNRLKAAELLGINRSSLYQKIHKYNL